MKRKMLLVAACAAALWSVSAIAADVPAASAAKLPTADEVRAAVNAGDWPKAESMVREVVAAKPNNARAHYFYAEILAHEGKFSDAAAQAHKARELDPALSFDKNPDNFRKFEREVDRAAAGPIAATQPQVAQPQATTVREVPPPAVPVQAARSGIPGWVWVGGIALVLFLIFRAVSRRALANNMASGGGYGMNPGMAQPGYGPAQPGYGPGYGAGYGQSPGGGLLRTGLAAGAGVAGGMLLERMLEGNRHDDNGNYGNNGGGGYIPQGGGGDNGYNQATSDLENRPFDFGQGGNDWSDGGGGGGGGGDFSSGSSDDGGGW